MCILEKISFFLLCLSIMNILRHSFNLITELRREQPEKIALSKRDTIFLGISISYILTIFFTGF